MRLDDFEKRAREAAEQCREAYFNAEDFMGEDVQRPDRSFLAGAKWARDEMQAEIDALRAQNHIQTSASVTLRALDDANAEIERLKAELREVNAMYVAQARGLESERKRLYDLLEEQQGDLEQAHTNISILKGDLEQAKALIAEDFFKQDRDHWHKECERLSLLAESYRSILAGLIDSSDRGDTGSDSSYASYWAEARQALEDGK